MVMAKDLDIRNMTRSEVDELVAWAAREGIEQGVPTPVMSLALLSRFSSRGNQDFADRLLANLRNQFGGHAVKSE